MGIYIASSILWRVPECWAFSVARVRQCAVLLSSGKPDLLPWLYCGYDRSIYLQFITITTTEPEHSKFIPFLVATHLMPVCL